MTIREKRVGLELGVPEETEMEDEVDDRFVQF
jgi:hypothetical protein